METGGLVITKSLYGNPKALKKADESGEMTEELASQLIDVTLPLNFLINDSGQLKVRLLQIPFLSVNGQFQKMTFLGRHFDFSCITIISDFYRVLLKTWSCITLTMP